MSGFSGFENKNIEGSANLEFGRLGFFVCENTNTQASQPMQQEQTNRKISCFLSYFERQKVQLQVAGLRNWRIDKQHQYRGFV